MGVTSSPLLDSSLSPAIQAVATKLPNLAKENLDLGPPEFELLPEDLGADDSFDLGPSSFESFDDAPAGTVVKNFKGGPLFEHLRELVDVGSESKADSLQSPPIGERVLSEKAPREVIDIFTPRPGLEGCQRTSSMDDGNTDLGRRKLTQHFDIASPRPASGASRSQAPGAATKGEPQHNVAAWPSSEGAYSTPWYWADNGTWAWMPEALPTDEWGNMMWQQDPSGSSWMFGGYMYDGAECYGESYGQEQGYVQEACIMQPQPQSKASTCVVLPPLRPGGEAYRPKWPYGPSWPFSHAPTTLTISNLPAALTQADLVATLDASGFNGRYDFVFLPASLRTGKSCGEATVNLTTHSCGQELAGRIHNFKAWGVEGACEPCAVKWSVPLQGLEEHIEKYRNHPANRESVPGHMQPMLFNCGWQVQFPPPTRPCRPQRLGRN